MNDLLHHPIGDDDRLDRIMNRLVGALLCAAITALLVVQAQSPW